MSKEKKIKRKINTIFKNFKFDSKSKSIVESAHNLLKNYETMGI